MAAILNSSSWIQWFLSKKTSLIHSHSTWWWQPSWILPSWIQTFCTKKNFTHSFSLNMMMAAILNSAILNFAILDSATLVFTQTHSHLPRLVPTISTKKNFTHSFWLNLMLADILNSAILDSDTAMLDSDTLLSSLGFTQKHSHSTLTLTQTNSIWLIWWWEPSWILPSWIQPFCTKLWLKLIQSDSDSLILTQLDDVRNHEFCHLGFNHFEQKKTSLIHCHSTWWSQTSWILPSWIQPFCTKKLHSFILTQLDDGSHLEFYHLGFRHYHPGFRHLVIFSQIRSKTLSLLPDSDSN